MGFDTYTTLHTNNYTTGEISERQLIVIGKEDEKGENSTNQMDKV
jgi:hypothetical protein